MMKTTAVRFSAGAVLVLGMALAHMLAESKDKVSDPTRTPVLVELFTSEGCSDCPPADALLERLDRSQPVAGVELIVLSEHVDYWNGIGWKDPWSSTVYSERQAAYASRFRLDGVYTPQMVVDGKVEFVGSDERRAIAAIGTAAKAPKIIMSLSGAHITSKGVLAVQVDAAPLPSGSGAANVLLAVVDEQDESHVMSGENGGRTLRHVAVLRGLKGVGPLNPSKGLSESVEITIPSGNGNLRLIAFAQEGAAGEIRGVAAMRFSK